MVQLHHCTTTPVAYYTAPKCHKIRTHLCILYKGKNTTSLAKMNIAFTALVCGWAICVGYGNIAPKTTWGRITVVVYAMIGIPIMLVCVALIGETMADVFRFVYFKLCCCGLCAQRARRRRRQREAAERGPRDLAGHQHGNPPPSLSELYQEQMRRSRRDQHAPVVVDDYDDLVDDEVLQHLTFDFGVQILLVFLSFIMSPPP